MFGLDCLRSGGTTAAAAAGAEDRLFFRNMVVGKLIVLKTVMLRKT
jgi:hypothetical protein